MAYLIDHTFNKKYSSGLFWGDLYEAPGAPLGKLASGGQLSAEAIALISSTELLITPPSGFPLPDINGAKPWLVSRKVVDILRNLDAKSVDTIPVKLRDRKTGDTYSDYFVLHVRLHLDCIDVDRTSFTHGDGLQGAIESGYNRYGDKPYALKRVVVAGHHLWLADVPSSNIYFASSELRDRLVEVQAFGWEFHKCSFS